jgi:hypothetical protein
MLTNARSIDVNSNFLQIIDGSEQWASFGSNEASLGGGFKPTLIVDNNFIYTAKNGISKGLILDFTTQNYQLGDEQYFITADTTNVVINTHLNSQKQGLQLLDLEYYFGDFDGVNNSNYILINDSAENIYINSSKDLTLKANTLFLTGTLTVGGGPHSNSGQHLKVTINGTPYVIQLLNP